MTPTFGREAFEVAQGASQSSSAAALQQMANRFAAGDGRLAGLIRLSQDMLTRQRDIEKAILSVMSARGGQKDRPRLEAMRKQVDARLGRPPPKSRSNFPITRR